LSNWNLGKQKDWVDLDRGGVRHPEVQTPVGPHLYLGFGPLVYDRQIRQTNLKAGAALQGGEDAVLALAFPDGKERPRIELAVSLLNLFGTLGGRSRNGWGSFSLASVHESTPELKTTLEPEVLRDWREALTIDWPHALGCDELGPLIWQTEALPDWKAVMRRLAEIKIKLRTQPAFAFKDSGSGLDAINPEPRHWLSYPVTHHDVAQWKKANLRLPNTLRFKVRPTANGQLQGVIYHVPCKPPREFSPELKTLLGVWTNVHDHLDKVERLKRSPA
jgi:CRISPR-associated protein Cmr1